MKDITLRQAYAIYDQRTHALSALLFDPLMLKLPEEYQEALKVGHAAADGIRTVLKFVLESTVEEEREKRRVADLPPERRIK